MSDFGVRSLVVFVGLLVVLSGGPTIGSLSDTPGPVAVGAAADCNPDSGTGFIAGEVRDTENNRVESASYEVIDVSTNETVVAGNTSDGRFTAQVNTGEYYVRVSAEGYEDGQTESICIRPDMTEQANVVLEKNPSGGSISITVSDESGNEREGVTTKLWVEDDYDDPALVIRSATTDGQGKVAFDGLAVGSDSDSPIRYVVQVGSDNSSTETVSTTLELYEPAQTSDSDTIIAESATNAPPTAEAGPGQTVTAGEAITLDGTGSSDPDGDSLSYYWNGTQYLSGTSSATPTFDAPDIDTTETYTATLLVDDGDGGSDTDSVTITVEPQPLEANDLDGDGKYEDVDGDGTLSVADAETLDANRNADWVQNNVEKFDFNEDGSVDGADVCELRQEAGGECQPIFEISDFDAPESVSTGESAVATITVENTGEGNGTGTVSYEIAGDVIGSQEISLAPGEREDVDFAVRPADIEPGEYEQRVTTDDDEQRTTLSVIQGGPTSTPTVATTTTADDQSTATDTEAGLGQPTTVGTDGASGELPLVPLGAGAGAIVFLLVASITASRMRRGPTDESSSGPPSSGGEDGGSQVGASNADSGGPNGGKKQAETASAAAGPDRSSVPNTLTYDDFERGERIGSGGNADVYRATVAGPDGPATIALKEPRIEGTIATGEVERLLSEAETWAKLDDHEHIVAVHDWDSQPLPWIAMEYMDGGNLATALPLDYERSVDVLQSVASAIEYAHRAGIAHGDLKPSNVLFAGNPATGVPKVGDWGLAKILLEHSQSTEGLSPAYAAPEQFQGGSQDIVGPQLTDIYQLGAVAYEVFTDQPPFEGTPFEVMEQVRSEQPTPPTEIDPSLPVAVDTVIATAMAKDPDDRYEAMIDFRRAIEEL